MDVRYQIERATVGEGGFGRIDKAIDTELDRPVAIKTLDPLFKVGPTDTDIERFRREAKALARLSHPNIPAIYDVDFAPEAGEFRIIFEWIEGLTLCEYLQDRGVLSLEETRTYFSSICSALGHAHERGLVHRDVKPSNIILSPNSTACYLVDFGIALKADDLTITGSTPIGTAGYMSPEQERGEDVTPASDVFALGVVLYESLSGVRPSVGGYRPLAVHNEAIPPGIDQLIQSALQEDPRRRPQTATEFNARLALALRTHATFASTLDEGSLHEVQLALSEMTASGFAGLPVGQRVVVITRLRDLINVDKETMRRAVAAFLAEIVRLSHTDDSTPYDEVVKYALDYGYEKQFGETWQGDAPTRAALNEVALICSNEAHAAISSEVLALVDDTGLADRAGWYFHDLRLLLQKLLINPACSERATALGEALTRVNELSH